MYLGGADSLEGLLCLAVSTFITLLLLYVTVRLAVKHAIWDARSPRPPGGGPPQGYWKPLNPNPPPPEE